MVSCAEAIKWLIDQKLIKLNQIISNSAAFPISAKPLVAGSSLQPQLFLLSNNPQIT